MGKPGSCLWSMHTLRVLDHGSSNFKQMTWGYCESSNSDSVGLRLRFYQTPSWCWCWCCQSGDHTLRSKGRGDRVPWFTWGEVTPPPGGNQPHSRSSGIDIKGGRLNKSISEEVRPSSKLPPTPKSWLPSATVCLPGYSSQPRRKNPGGCLHLHLSTLQIFLVLNSYVFSHFVY